MRGWIVLLALCASCSELADVDRSEVGRTPDAGRPGTSMDASTPSLDATVPVNDAGDAGDAG